MNAKIKNQYYWIIALVAVIQMTVSGGVLNSIGGLFLIPVTETLGITRGQFSLAGSVQSLVAFFCSLISGVLFIKFGFRKLVTVCLLLTAVGLGLMSGSRNMAMLCAGFVMLGTCSGFCTTIGSTRLVGSWFRKHHGLVLGIVTAFSGIGGSIFSLILSGVIESSGWRKSYLVAAGFFVASALLVFLVVRSRPEDLGMKPYGEGFVPKNNRRRKSDDHWEGFCMEELVKKPVFYLMIVGTFLSCGCPYMVFSVISPHIQDCGMGAEFGAKVQSLVLFALAGAKLGFGFLSDRIGVKTTTMISLIASSVSLVLMATITTPATACVAAVVYAIGLTLTGIAAPLLTTALFGYQAGSKAIGVIQSMVSASCMVAGPLCNMLRDRLGSYVPVFWGTAVVSIAVIAVYMVIYTMSAKERIAFEQKNKEGTVE